MNTDCRRAAQRATGRARAGTLAEAVHRRWLLVRRTGEHGMATAEYAVATLAAVAFAALLLTILKSDEVRGMLLGIIQQALSIGS